MYDCKTPNNTWLANPEPFLSDIRTSFDEPSNSVDFLLAAMHFNEIEPTGNMDKIQLVNNALELNSGYTLADVLSQKSAQACMLTKSRCFAGEVNFTLPSENIQTNVSIEALKISIDSINFTPLTVDSSYTYTLSPTENQAIYLQMTIAGQVITTKLLLDVIRKKDFQQENNNTKNPHDDIFHTTLPPDIAGRKIDGDYFGDSTVYATVLLSCGSTFEDIQKPFIVLDGIDLTWDQNFSTDNKFFGVDLLFQDSSLFNAKFLGDYLIDNDYDIIFVDYSDHHISIKDNAAGVIDLIDSINVYKAANGSTHKNKMMGFSMGGVLGKWALLDMEENDKEHEVDKYFSFDSPMSGANISPALQGLIHQIADILTTEV